MAEKENVFFWDVVVLLLLSPRSTAQRRSLVVRLTGDTGKSTGLGAGRIPRVGILEVTPNHIMVTRDMSNMPRPATSWGRRERSDEARTGGPHNL